MSQAPAAFERIEARTAEVGAGFTIRRALPTRARRMIGAWCFLDHLGPANHAAGAGLHVGPHPHIGLQTFTWVMEGEILHRDSLGYEALIRPGQVNLMTAGRGISHAEDAPNENAGRIHAAQLWIALPEAERHCAAAFDHYEDLPVVGVGGFTATLLAGDALGARAPARIYTPLVGIDLHAPSAAQCELPLRAQFEYGVMVTSGVARVGGEDLQIGSLLYFPPGRTALAIECDAATQLLVIGGEPFPESVLLWWNFVARSNEEMIAATHDWNHTERFGTVSGSPSARLIAPDPGTLHLKGNA